MLRKNKKQKKKRVKKVRKLFYEDKCIRDNSLIYKTSNYEGIKVIYDPDKTRLLNGVLIIPYKIYVDYTTDDYEMKKIIMEVISKVNKVIDELKITLPVDVFLFDSSEIENGSKLKLYIVFRVKLVNNVNYVYKPIPDNIIIGKYMNKIIETLNAIVKKNFNNYNVSKVPLIELKSRQLRAVGFPPKREYVILDNVKNIEDYVSDDTLSFLSVIMNEVSDSEVVEISGVKTSGAPIARKLEINNAGEDREVHRESSQVAKSLPIERPQPGGRPLPVERSQPIGKPLPSERPQPMIPPTNTNVPIVSSRPEVTPNSNENPVSKETQPTMGIDQDIETNVDIVSNVTQPPELDTIADDLESGQVVESIDNDGIDSVDEFGYRHFYDEINGVVVKDVDVLFNVNSNVSREFYESMYYSYLDSVTARVFNLENPFDYDIISSSIYNTELLKIINGLPFNSGSTVKMLPVGITAWGEKYYLPIEFCENPQSKSSWQAVTNRVITIVGKMGSGKTHVGSNILELNALSGGSSILIITAPNEVKAYSILKKMIEKVRPLAKSGDCSSLTNKNERNLCELLRKLNATDFKIQLATISSLKDSISGVDFDILITIPANELNYGLIRHLSTGTSSRDFANLSRAFRIGILGLYEYMLNFFKKENFRRSFADFVVGDPPEDDPDDDKRIGSMYHFFVFMKSISINSVNTNSIETITLSRLDNDARAVYDKVKTQFISISSQYKSILQMFKGISYPILEDLDEPVVASSNITKDFVFEKFFKPYTLTVIFMPMELGEIYSKVGIILFKVLLEIFANSMSEFRELQRKRNETFYPIILGVDEAHLYFKKTLVQDVVGRVETLVEKIKMISKLSRKYSFGLVLMSQNINDIPVDVFKNSGVRIYGVIDDIREIRDVFDNPKMATFFKQHIRKRWFLIHDDMIKGGYIPFMSTRRLFNILDDEPYTRPSMEVYNTIRFSGVGDIVNENPNIAKSIEKYRKLAEEGKVPEIGIIRT